MFEVSISLGDGYNCKGFVIADGTGATRLQAMQNAMERLDEAFCVKGKDEYKNLNFEVTEV